jgi:macrocin-O-methyltransferase TylF-like protien
MDRDFYGFDSFEGLSEPSAESDYAGWAKGQYAAGYGEVAANLRLKDRPRLKLVKGFFDKSLKEPEAQAVNEIAYARIDCDIYQPAVECLDFLAPRLSDGAILAFDDWVYDIQKGETKAFHDWVPCVPHLKFEFLGFASWRFYMRVRHRD